MCPHTTTYMSVFYYILQAAVLAVAQETKKIADSNDQKRRGYHVVHCVFIAQSVFIAQLFSHVACQFTH